MLLYILLFLLLLAGSLAAFAFFAKSLPEKENQFLPFAMLPVSDSSPAARAFLEFYASQIAWMDSEILSVVLLVYPEEEPEIRALCEDMGREYDFFAPVSLSQAEKFLETKLKKSEIL